MGFDEALLAAADIHDQAEGQRDVRAAGEEGDFLRHAVFGDFEIVLCQVGDEIAFLVADGESDVDQADIDADRAPARGRAAARRARPDTPPAAVS